MAGKKCVLYDRECINCGECKMCELDPKKVCDNCMKCVKGDSTFRTVYIGKQYEKGYQTKNENR